MAAIDRFSNFRVPIREGYFPKLDTLVAGRAWPARPDNVSLQNINRPADETRVDINTMEQWRDRFVQAVNSGMARYADGRQVPLTIDILGNMMESSILSPNREFYGNLHNMGHNLVGFFHDPNHLHLENFGVIGDSTTAMRDPVFYRWHAHIDDLFQAFKVKLAPYTAQELTFPGVQVTGVQLQSTAGGTRANNINTFWQQSDVNLSRGLDFSERGNVFARFTHLQHDDFNYSIAINNNSGAQQLGMARIFMAPRIGFNRQAMNFNEQRLMMIEMDRFVVQLNPGQNMINRTSGESNVTIPFETTFRNYDRTRATDEAYNICGCG